MNKRLLYVSSLIVLCILVFSQCINKRADNGAANIRGAAFAGSDKCISCHKSIYDDYMHTGHSLTSAPASAATVKGSFTAPGNVFTYNDGNRVVMESRDSGLFQVAYKNNILQEIRRFDIAVGSGRKAQTFLSWSADRYFQLPLSYFVPAHSWANSPGFPASYPKYDRMIPSTCFGCHSSAVGIKSVSMQGMRLDETFEKNVLVYGIDCERCHGGAAEHVTFHASHPQEKKAMHMTKISTLQNQQKLDMCALCHSGLGAPLKPAFEFKPGDALSDYYFPDYTSPTKATEIDVHGKQYQLFTASRCFIKSDNMNCSSCHNPHNSERDQLQTFSTRCMNCHKTADHTFCKLNSIPEATLAKNCIDCHMPALPSVNITLLTNGESSPTSDSIRTHLIRVYPEETRKILARLGVRQ